jgi:ribonuclease BN (tRNA processing enzyme)
VDAVLALDRAGMLDCELRPVADRFHIGPFAAQARMLPHSLPNAGIRLAAGGEVLAYTGDSGPCADVVALARDADVFVAEATFLDGVPDGARGTLSSVRDAGRQAALAGAGRLLLTHLQPGTDPAAAIAVAREEFDAEVGVAAPEV